ncbi:MAG: tRNA lysidine(34) synthetase TilS [Myxococcota bacterium]
MTAPALPTLVRRLQRERGLWSPGAHLLCACSGGPDSTAMLHALAHLREDLGHRVSAVGIDHGLRPEAGRELEGLRATADALGVSFRAERTVVARGPGLQARARTARHALFQRLAAEAKADAVAIGHTADDRAETVLMRLLRGSGARGLAAMPPRAPGVGGAVPLVRPLLLATRRDVVAHLRHHRLETAEDPSNADPRFLRSRVRHTLLPHLEASWSPSLTVHLNRIATELCDEVFGEGDDDDPWAGMTRGQRDALARAIRAGRSGITVRLSGGREVELRFHGPKSRGRRGGGQL